MTTIGDLSSLKGKTALVTGAAGHLGRVICDALAELGADLIAVDRKGSALDEVAASVEKQGKTRCVAMFCDLEADADRAALIAEAAKKPLHVLVNNAAFVGTSELQGWGTTFEKQTVDTWRRALEVNLTSVFDLCKGLNPALRDGKGSIINVASIYGALGPDWSLYAGTAMSNPAAYAASKGGLIQLSRWLATTLAPDVRVNTISPGGIARGQPESFVAQYTARTPLKRMMTEDDVKGAVAFLASGLSGYVTGQNIFIDGGWSSW